MNCSYGGMTRTRLVLPPGMEWCKCLSWRSLQLGRWGGNCEPGRCVTVMMFISEAEAWQITNVFMWPWMGKGGFLVFVKGLLSSLPCHHAGMSKRADASSHLLFHSSSCPVFGLCLLLHCSLFSSRQAEGRAAYRGPFPCPQPSTNPCPIIFNLSSPMATSVGARRSFLLYIPQPLGVTQPAKRGDNCCSREQYFHIPFGVG